MIPRVLIVDDDPRLCELSASYLAQNGFEPAWARDTMAGMAALASSPFDAVLLDVRMPGMSGLEVCTRIRDESRIPILMVTAKGDETDRVVGLELGADDHIVKPFSPRELLARLRAVLRRSGPEGAAERVKAHRGRAYGESRTDGPGARVGIELPRALRDTAAATTGG